MPHLYYSILANLSETPERRLRMTDLAETAEDHPQPADVRGDPAGEGRTVRREDCQVGQARAHRGPDRRGHGGPGARRPGMSRRSAPPSSTS